MYRLCFVPRASGFLPAMPLLIFLISIIMFVLVEGRESSENRASSCDISFRSDVAKNGTLMSPGYPKPYPSRSHCRYDFQGRGKERIQIVFSEFNLYHSVDEARECETMDSVNAYVLIEGRMEKIDTFCGSMIPKPLMSNGPRLMLEFSGIYSSRQVRGFLASYTFTENFGVTAGTQLPEYPCAFAFNSSESLNGTFSSPNFPGFYPRNTECHYFFNGRIDEKVHLHFTYFDVEGVTPCESISASDYVEFSNFMATDRKYSRYCGQLKAFHIESDRKFFRVTFRSNDRLDGTGFRAKYQFIHEIDMYVNHPVPERNQATPLSALLLSLDMLWCLGLLTTIFKAVIC